MEAAGSDESSLYVPEEFEAAHLDDARRTVTRSPVQRRFARQVAKATSWQGAGREPRQRLRGLAYVLHALAAVLAVAFAAVTNTWLVGLAVLAIVGLSLAATLRLLVVIERAQAEEAQKQPR